MLHDVIIFSAGIEYMNTPEIETEHLRLRKFTQDDIPVLLEILQDRDVNRFLPWFPLENIEDARHFFETRYSSVYTQPCGYAYAVCLKNDDTAVGYINADNSASHDLGYGLRKDYWNRGIITEAGKALANQIRKDGIFPFLTATHDVNNTASGKVMEKLGMRYMYSYEELWQPKNFKVTFRMYQLNFDPSAGVYMKYSGMNRKHITSEPDSDEQCRIQRDTALLYLEIQSRRRECI